MTARELLDQAIHHQQAGRVQEALQLYAQILAADPNNIDALHLSGLLLASTGQFGPAIAALKQATRLHPTQPDLHYNLAKAFRDAGQLADAVSAYRQAIALRPNFPSALNNLGNTLKDMARPTDAADAYQKAIAIAPSYPEPYYNLGTILQAQGDVTAAIDHYRHAIALKPNYPHALNNLGTALQCLDRVDDAIVAYRKAIELRPQFAEAASNLGTAMKDAGRVSEAIGCFEQSLQIVRNPKVAGNLLTTLHYLPDISPHDLLKAHRQWNRDYVIPLGVKPRPHSTDPSPSRRLRIGYVSPDLREHPVGRFMLPLLSHHNHEHFEIYCYSDAAPGSAMTNQLKSQSDHWRDTNVHFDEQLAETIRTDAIDILVDLTLHMDGNRLLMFACKPAPVQITYLAYCSTSGLDAMDYRLSDPYLDPPGSDTSCYSEATLCLPRTYWCYPAPSRAPQEISPLPALASGHLTFGCLNNYCKISPHVLNVWARVFQALPASKLILHSPVGSHRNEALSIFAAQGVDAHRIQFVEKSTTEKYFQTYNQIDIALDPFPFNGGTTTCDALWMGVPVITLAKDTAVSRAGSSILSNAGLPNLIAHTQDQYIELAKCLARDLPNLAKLRSELRQQIKESPLMDAPTFARDIEAAYRQAWTNWCHSRQ